MRFFHSLQLMDNVTGALDGVIFDLKEVCIFNIKATMNVTLNSTDDKSTIDSTSDNPRQEPDFVSRVLRHVQEVSCPGEPIACNGHGTCKKGRCECDTGKLQVYVFQCMCVCVYMCVGPCIFNRMYTASSTINSF